MFLMTELVGLLAFLVMACCVAIVVLINVST